MASEERRRALLLEALDGGAEYVDVEWRAGFADVVTRDPRRIVLSSHDFQGVPRRSRRAACAAMRRSGAGTIKIAVTATRLSDALPLLPLAQRATRSSSRWARRVCRRGCSRRAFGSRWTYAGNAVAPGQIPAARMLDEFRFRAVGRRARRSSASSATTSMHSLSPAMHNAAFAARGIDAVYVPLQAARLRRLPDVCRRDGRRGRQRDDSVQARCAARGRAVPTALTRAVGAANTLRRAATALGSDEHRRGRLSRAARDARPERCVVRARRCWAPAVGTRRRGRAALARRARHGARAAAANRRPRWLLESASRRGRVATAGAVVGSAGQLHAARRAGRARRDAAARRTVRRAGWSTT